jgi:uncharacterized phiE125 gp8 family phage protein
MLTRLRRPEYPSISIALIKTHLRLNHQEEDEYLQQIIDVAEDILEHYIGQSLLEQTWQLVWHNPIERCISLQERQSDVTVIPLFYPPIIRIESVVGFCPGEKDKEINRYRLYHHGQRVEIILSNVYPVVQITYQAGMAHKPSGLPAPIRQALLYICAHLYENRENPDINQDLTLANLLQPFIRRGLG